MEDGSTMPIWQLTCTIFEDKLPFYLNAFMEFGASTTWEKEKQGYEITLISNFPWERGDPLEKIRDVLACFDLEVPTKSLLEQLPDCDWVVENRKSFKPLSIGQFFFHGSHYEGPKPAGKIAVELDASMAFGSGEHATTKGCLIALAHVLGECNPEHVLDMGCGSGILSIAIGKLSHGKIVASDIEAASLKNTQDNLRHNDVEGVSVRCGNGYATLEEGETFDLIVSNILAQPLIQMAPDLSEVLNAGGVAILSGFLEEQVDAVVDAHEAVGLTLKSLENVDGWVTAVMSK